MLPEFENPIHFDSKEIDLEGNIWISITLPKKRCGVTLKKIYDFVCYQDSWFYFDIIQSLGPVKLEEPPPLPTDYDLVDYIGLSWPLYKHEYFNQILEPTIPRLL